MPYCLKCKSEYTEGNTVCLDCGEKLVDEVPDDIKHEIREGKKPKSRQKPMPEYVYKEMVFLCSTGVPAETDVVESLLRSYGIDTMRKSKRADGIFHSVYGMPAFGLEVYVPADRLEEARGLLGIEEPEEQKTAEPKVKKRLKAVLGWAIVLIVAIMFAYFSWLSTTKN